MFDTPIKITSIWSTWVAECVVQILSKKELLFLSYDNLFYWSISKIKKWKDKNWCSTLFYVFLHDGRIEMEIWDFDLGPGFSRIIFLLF